MADFYYRFFSKNGKKENYFEQQKELDKKLVYSLSKNKIPSLKQVKYLKKFLNRREIFLLRISFLILIASFIFWGAQFYKSHLVVMPARGGAYTEGVLGAPQYINPLFSGANDVDSDISNLIFSSLFKHDIDGLLVGDLATSYSISEDAKIYTVKIRQDAKWHSGEKLTVDDIVFTFNAIVDSRYKSPLRFSFSGVSISKIDDETIVFSLSEPYAAFLELLTFGILPQTLWAQITPEAASLAEFNIKPIGSGPYKFKSLVKDKKSGAIKYYHLTANEDYYQSTPLITEFSFKFFVDYESLIADLNNNSIDGIGYLPRAAKDRLISPDSLYFHNLNLPHLTAVFFNQEKNNNFKNVNIRKALAMAIDKNEIATEIFQGEVTPADGPILSGNFAYNPDITKYEFNLIEAKKLISNEGWATTTISQDDLTIAQEMLNSSEVATETEDSATSSEAVENVEEGEGNTEEARQVVSLGVGTWFYKKDSSPKEYLVINLTTVDNEDSVLAAEAIKNFWEEAGVKTLISIISASLVQSEVINPRNFEALFYGQVLGSDPDSYVFWHSSQAGAGGLNLANYNNKKIDTLLEEARLISDREQRVQKYKEFQEIIANEVPAIFMYSPLYTYVQNKKVNGFSVASILKPADRFADIINWHVKTSKKIAW